jgi:hypothetical protein
LSWTSRPTVSVSVRRISTTRGGSSFLGGSFFLADLVLRRFLAHNVGGISGLVSGVLSGLLGLGYL